MYQQEILIIVTISQKSGSLSGTKAYNGTHEFFAGAIPYFWWGKTVINHRPSEYSNVESKSLTWNQGGVCKEVLSAKSSLVKCNVACNLLGSFLEGNLDTIGLFQTLFNQIVWCAIGTQRHPKSNRLNWSVFCTLIRSDIVRIFTCLDLDHMWVLIAYLLDCAGILTSANKYYNSDLCSSRRADWLLECG